MSKVVVRLHTKAKQGADYLDFENEDLLTLNFEQQSTTNYSNPIYDTYPSYGNIEIQDKNLTLYNMAINDEFNDYEYPVEIFVNNSIVGKFIITELPVYSYASKTLSITVGDSLSKIDSLYYGGYKYPLEQQTIDVIFKDILKSYDGTLTDEEIETILEESVYSAKTSGLVITHTTYKEYMQTITVPYPYIAPNKTFRQAFQSVLTVAQCALITDKVTKYRLVRMDGNSPKTEEEIIAILQNQMLSQFIPTIILPNKFNICEVQRKKVVQEYYVDNLIENIEFNYTDTAKIDETTNSDTDTSQSLHNTSFYQTGSQGLYDCSFGYITFNGTNFQYLHKIQSGSYEGAIVLLPYYIDDNLKTIKRLSVDKEKGKPYYSVSFSQKITRQKGLLTTNWDGRSKYLVDKNSFVATGVEEVISNEIDNTTPFTNEASFHNPALGTITVKGVQYTDLCIIENLTEKERFVDKSKVAIGNKFYLYIAGDLPSDSDYATGYYVVNRYEDGVDRPITSKQIVGYKYTIENIFNKITISYYGDYSFIAFNDDNYSKSLSTTGKKNIVSISTGNELVQDDMAQTLAYNILTTFKDGLNGGQLNAMGWDYYGFKGLSALSKKIYYTTTAVSASETSPFQKFFEIGDVVMPCKDNKNTPIITRGVDYENNPVPMYFQVVKNSVTFQGGKFSQRLTLREAKMPKKELTKYYPPTLSISGSTLTITPDSRNPEPVQYKIYDDDGISQPVAFLTTSNTTINLASYITVAGTHTIYAVTTGTLSTSSPSNKVKIRCCITHARYTYY